MSLFITSLNSGSNGNCYYIGNHNEAVLIDAGISCRETETRMKRLGLDLNKLKAIFISHEHTDHVTGLARLASKHQLPVYITKGTQQFGRVNIEKHLVNRFSAEEPVRVGRLLITAFSKIHDAGDPHSFIVECEGVKVGIFTDIGIVCKQLTKHFKQCHAAFLEANYDEEMLMNGTYPYYLKKRISDGKGHLSNVQALELFQKHRPPFMSHLILSHLSKNNNHPDLVKNLFSKHADKTEIIIASRYEETALLYIGDKKMPLKLLRKGAARVSENQLSLF